LCLLLLLSWLWLLASRSTDAPSSSVLRLPQRCGLQSLLLCLDEAGVELRLERSDIRRLGGRG